MERSFLLESSTIFEGSDLIDRVRQCIIDIKIEKPLLKDLLPIINDVTESLSSVTSEDLCEEIINLGLYIFSIYHQDLVSVFLDLCKKTFKSKGILKMISVLYQNVYSEYQDEVLLFEVKEFVRILEPEFFRVVKQKEHQISIFGSTFAEDEVRDMILSFGDHLNLEGDVFYPIISFIYDSPKVTNYVFLEKALKERQVPYLIEFLPKSVFSSIFFYSSLSLTDFCSLVDLISSDLFIHNVLVIETMVSQKGHRDFSIPFLKRCQKEKVQSLNRIQIIANTLIAADIVSDLANYLKLFEFVISADVARNINVFPDPSFLLKIMPTPNDFLPSEIISEGLDSISNFDDLKKILQKNIINKKLTSLSFHRKWFFSAGNDQIIGHTALLQNSQNVVSTILSFYRENPEIIGDISNYLKLLFIQHVGIAEELSRSLEFRDFIISMESLPPKDFWIQPCIPYSLLDSITDQTLSDTTKNIIYSGLIANIHSMRREITIKGTLPVMNKDLLDDLFQCLKIEIYSSTQLSYFPFEHSQTLTFVLLSELISLAHIHGIKEEISGLTIDNIIIVAALVFRMAKLEKAPLIIDLIDILNQKDNGNMSIFNMIFSFEPTINPAFNICRNYILDTLLVFNHRKTNDRLVSLSYVTAISIIENGYLDQNPGLWGLFIYIISFLSNASGHKNSKKEKNKDISDFFQGNPNLLQDIFNYLSSTNTKIILSKPINAKAFPQPAFLALVKKITHDQVFLPQINTLREYFPHYPQPELINHDAFINLMNETYKLKDWNSFSSLISIISFAGYISDIHKLFINTIQPDDYSKFFEIISCKVISRVFQEFFDVPNTILYLIHNKIPDSWVQTFAHICTVTKNSRKFNILFDIETEQSQFSLVTNQISAWFRKETEEKIKEYADAISYRYIQPPEINNVFLLKAHPRDLAMEEQFPVLFVREFIPLCISSTDYYFMEALDYLVNENPYLFSMIEYHNEVIMSLFDSLSFLSFSSDVQNTKDVIKSLNAVSVIHRLCFIPKYSDSFFNYAFSKNHLSQSQLICLLALIYSFMPKYTVQSIILSILMRFSWPSYATEILKRNYESEKDQKSVFKLTLYITIYFYQCLNSMTPEGAPVIELLSMSDNPFTTVFVDSLTTINARSRVNPIQFFEDIIPQSYLERNQFFKNHRKRPNLRPKPSFAHFENLVRSFQIPQNYPHIESSNGIKKEFFSQLSTRYQAIMLYHLLPNVRIPLNPAQHRYLVGKPEWVQQHIKNRPSLLITPDHYLVLHPIVQEINELFTVEDSTSPDSVTLIQFCCSDLIDILFVTMFASNDDSSVVNPILNVFRLLANSTPALMCILDIINEKIISVNTEKMVRILEILDAISDSPDFNIHYPDIASNSVINALSRLQNRDNENIVNIASRIFGKIQYSNPRYQHYISFMLLSENSKIVSKALELFSKCNDSIKESLIQQVLITFDNQFKISAEISDFNMLSSFLSVLPSLSSMRRPQLLQVLKQALSKYSIDLLPLIGSLLQALAPPSTRSVSISNSHSHSIQLSEDSNMKSSIIPLSISMQDPEFWQIISDNHQLFSDLISENPGFLENELRFFLGYPQILQFPQKVLMFRNSMISKHKSNFLNIHVRRSHILIDSFQQLSHISADKFLGHISVQFRDEQGYDAGGVKRDWFTSLTKELFNPNYALFNLTSNGRSFQPNPSSYINHLEHKSYFKFAGKIIARAIIEEIHLDAHLTTSMCKHILGTSVSLRDLEDIDEVLHSSLNWMLHNDVTPLEFTFIADFDDIGVHKTVSLKSGGENILVTNENKEEYIALMVQHRLKNQIKAQLDAFLEGFHSLIKPEELSMFTPNELDLLICGVPEFDVEDLITHCTFRHPYTMNTQVVKYFFEAIRKWTKEDLAKLLLFITGSSQVPIGGFVSFSNTGRPIIIEPGGQSDRLPAAHTCTNTIDLPEYKTEEELNQKLIYAIRECNSFGFI